MELVAWVGMLLLAVSLCAVAALAKAYYGAKELYTVR